MKKEILIRKAQRKDIPKFVSAIARSKAVGTCTPKAYFNWIVQEGIALVAEEEEQPIGFVLAERNSKAAAHVSYVFVRKKYRREGLGSQLMSQFLHTCRRKGIKYIDLHAKRNTLPFYHKFGFRSEGRYALLCRKM